MGIVLTSCKEETLPKPSAHLRLDYPEASYADFESECPFIFDFNTNTKVKSSDCDITIHYPKMKATLYLSYKAVEDDLNTLLRDAQKLTYEHVVKADDIIERPFINSDDEVYGMFYQVGGNAATNTQFYVTDSLQHFITGSVYFYAKPNFDSIMPATSYIKNDVQNLMETLRWK
jgi:gliding motility-associated lipoprotein GldD